MSYISNLLINLLNKKVGTDIYSNTYYRSTNANYLGIKKRLVIYSKMNQKMEISPAWHAWLHYLTDEIPNDTKLYAPEKEVKLLKSKLQRYSRWYPKI